MEQLSTFSYSYSQAGAHLSFRKVRPLYELAQSITEALQGAGAGEAGAVCSRRL